MIEGSDAIKVFHAGVEYDQLGEIGALEDQVREYIEWLKDHGRL